MPDTMWNDPFYRDLVPQRHHRPEPRPVMSGGRLDYAENSTLTVDADFTFDDALDIANPLHHLPIVNTAYREWTGDQISPHARVMGGAIFGPVGLMSATVNVVMEQETGRDMAGTAMAIVTGEELGRPAAVAEAPAPPSTPRPSLPSVAMAPEDLMVPPAPVMPATAAAVAAPRAPGALASVPAGSGPSYDRAGPAATTARVPAAAAEIAAGPVIDQAPPAGVGPAPDPRPQDVAAAVDTPASGPVTISNGLDAALTALAAASEQGAAVGAIGGAIGGGHSAESATLAYQNMAMAGGIPLRRPSESP